MPYLSQRNQMTFNEYINPYQFSNSFIRFPRIVSVCAERDSSLFLTLVLTIWRPLVNWTCGLLAKSLPYSKLQYRAS